MCLFQVSYAIVLFGSFIRECEQYYDILAARSAIF